MRAIIFDFDGVIANSYDFNLKTIKNMGIEIDDELFKAHHDGNVYEKAKIPFTQESLNTFFSKYYDGITRVKPFIHLQDIENLHKKYELFIISSSNEDAIEKFLQFNNMKKYITHILGFQFHKSKIQKFKYLLNHYNYSTNEIIFITDTLGDILEAHEVEVKTIAVNFGFHEIDRLKKGNPFAIISNFEEIKSIIDEL